MRSEEPYKLQGYSILKSLSAPDYISDPDATGNLYPADVNKKHALLLIYTIIIINNMHDTP